MLFIDEIQMSPEEVALLFGVDLKKITKYGIFEINPKKKKVDRLNGGFRTPAGTHILCSFWAKNPVTNKTVNIRYAESVNPKQVGTQLIYEYQPKKILFPGEEFVMVLDSGKALFHYLCKDCLDSPFHEQGKPFYFYLQDKEKEARLRVQSKGRIYDAIAAIKDMTVDKMRTLAKGIGIPGVDQMDEEYLLIDALQTKAEQDPEKFIMDAKSKNTEFFGTLQNLIDKNAITFKNLGGLDRWYWAAGQLKGQEIVHVQTGQNAFEALKEFVVNNAQQYYKMIYDMDRSANVDNKLDAFLKMQQEEEELEERRKQLARKQAELNNQAAINLSKQQAPPPPPAPVQNEEIFDNTGEDDEEFDFNFDDVASEAITQQEPPVIAPPVVERPAFQLPPQPVVKKTGFDFNPIAGHKIDPAFDKKAIPTTWQQAMEYIQAVEGKRPNNVRGKELLEAIAAGTFKPE